MKQLALAAIVAGAIGALALVVQRWVPPSIPVQDADPVVADEPEPEVEQVSMEEDMEPNPEDVSFEVMGDDGLVAVTAPLVAAEVLGAGVLVEQTGVALAERTAKKAAEEAAELAAKTAAKTGAKVAVTSATKAVPVVGWALTAADIAARSWDGESISVDNIVESFQQDADALVQYGGMLAEDPVGTLQVTGDAFVELGAAVADAGAQAADVIATTVTNAGAALADAGSQAVNVVASTVTNAGAAIVDAGSQAVNVVAATVTSAAQTAASGVVDVVNTTASVISDLVHLNVPKVDIKLPSIKLW